MLPNIHPSWKKALSDEFSKTYYAELTSYVNDQYETQVVYPPKEKIFAAFDFCAFDDVKVVVIGQDPYHGPGQAHGLCFSVGENIPVPPSLKNIFTEISDDVAVPIPSSSNLTRWANQGVLLLNAVLTVRHGEAGSHARKGWENFTDAVIREVSRNKEHVVFMLWGGYAKKKGKLIDRSRHCVLESGHPSPLSANQKLWFKCAHFSKANHYLQLHGKTPIKW